MSVVERLREVADGYELSALSCEERGDGAAALSFATVAVVLREVAEALQEERAAA